MFRIRKTDGELSLEMNSDVRLIALIMQPSMDFLKQFGPSPSPDIFLMLRELVRNAMTHGNQNDPVKKVYVSLRRLGVPIKAGEPLDVSLAVSVEDEGAGFDHNALDLGLPEGMDHFNKRGLILVNAVVDRLEFNEVGNRVVAYTHLVGKTQNTAV